MVLPGGQGCGSFEGLRSCRRTPRELFAENQPWSPLSTKSCRDARNTVADGMVAIDSVKQHANAIRTRGLVQRLVQEHVRRVIRLIVMRERSIILFVNSGSLPSIRYVPKSGSMQTLLPPGFMTRTIPFTAATGSSIRYSIPSVRQASNRPSRKGSLDEAAHADSWFDLDPTAQIQCIRCMQ